MDEADAVQKPDKASPTTPEAEASINNDDLAIKTTAKLRSSRSTMRKIIGKGMA